MKAIYSLVVIGLMLLVAATPVKNGYEVGDTATDFKLKNVDGKMVSLADFKDANAISSWSGSTS